MKKLFVVSLLCFLSLCLNVNYSFANEIDALLNKLVEKGQLNAADSQEIRNETQQSIDEAKKIEKEEKEKDAKEKGPFYVKVGNGSAKIGGYVQFRYENFKDPAKFDQFRVKTAIVNIESEVVENTEYKVEIDVSKTDSKILNNALLKFKQCEYANISLGQFKIPFSEESLTSSSAIDTVERSIVVSNMAQERDRGIMLDANLFNKTVYYGLGVFNGTGQNADDDNNRKDFAGRIVFSPFADEKSSPLSGFSIGGNVMIGREAPVTSTDSYIFDSTKKTVKKQTTNTTDNYDRNRVGGLVKYEYQNIKIQGEYISQKKDKYADTTKDATSNGWYAFAGYRIPVADTKMAFQPLVKYETYDPDTAKDNDKQTITTVGLNWFLNDNTKLMFNDRFKKDDAGKNKYDEILVQAQIKF